jgi:hypothetical protein
MSELLLAGMVIGAVGGAIKDNSGAAIDNACGEFDKANKSLNDTIQKWKNIINDEKRIQVEIQKFGEALTANLHFYQAKKNDIHDAFRQQEFMTMILIGIFIFIIIITLLMKYFNVYENIWNFIVGKK